MNEDKTRREEDNQSQTNESKRFSSLQSIPRSASFLPSFFSKVVESSPVPVFLGEPLGARGGAACCCCCCCCWRLSLGQSPHDSNTDFLPRPQFSHLYTIRGASRLNDRHCRETWKRTDPRENGRIVCVWLARQPLFPNVRNSAGPRGSFIRESAELKIARRVPPKVRFGISPTIAGPPPPAPRTQPYCQYLFSVNPIVLSPTNLPAARTSRSARRP
jgi:hypothetical protein